MAKETHALTDDGGRWGDNPAGHLPQEDVGTAKYIADLTAQLAHLARSAQLGVLAYLLDMAATEARGSSAADTAPDGLEADGEKRKSG